MDEAALARAAVYGGPQPVVYRLASVVTILFMLALGLPALWGFTVSRFIPSHEGQMLSLAAGCLAAASLLALMATLRATRTRTIIPPRNNGVGGQVMIALLGFTMGFMGVQGGYLEWWTLANGSAGQVVVHVADYNSGGRRSVAGLDFKETPFLERRAVKVHYSNRDAAPQSGAPVELDGPVSRFGVDVARFSVLAGR